MKKIWKKIRMALTRCGGMTMVETLVALGVTAIFATGVTTVVVTSNSVSAKTDVISHFDRQNQLAISEFKTNPDPKYLKTVEPFSNMDYSAASVSFNKHYDSKFQPTNDANAPYYVSYQYVGKSGDAGFGYKEKDVVLQIFNQKKMPNGTYQNLQTSAAQGSAQIHTMSLTNTLVDPAPSPEPPSSNTSFRVSFVIEGGTFKDEAGDKRTVVVNKGARLKDILPKVNELQAASSLPARFTGWKRTGTSQVISANASMTVTSDLAISGAFEGIPCTVKFKIPYYVGSWSNNPGGEMRSYAAQEGVKVDGDGLALLFGKNSYHELFTGQAVFEGWFDDAGNPFTIGDSGTVLAGGWNAKTVTAKISIPSVKVKVAVAEGEAAGTYSLNVPVGGTISAGDIAAAAGKDWSKIENTGRRMLSGWKRQDNGTDFTLGSTVIASDWNNTTITAQYRNIFEANADMTLAAEFGDRPYWDITSSTYDFVQSGQNLQLRVKEDTTKANTPPSVANYEYYTLGDINTLKSKITDKGGDLRLNLNVVYNYYSVKDFLQKNADKKLYFNGKMNQSMAGKFDGTGAAFNMSSSANMQLKQLLGLTKNPELKITFTPRTQAALPAKQILEKERLGMYLELGAVGQYYHRDDEKYRLQFLRSDTPQAEDGTYLYGMEILGDWGNSILPDGKRMEPHTFWGGGRRSEDPTAAMGSNDLVLGAVGGPDWSDISIIDQLSLVIRNRSGTGAGFRLEFQTEGPQSDPNWRSSGDGSYMKRQFDNVVMGPDSVVKVKHVVVYVPADMDSGRGDKSVAFYNKKPVNENNAYFGWYLGYYFHGGWLEQNMSFPSEGGVSCFGWPTDDSKSGARAMTTGKINKVDVPAPIPLPDRFEIK